LTLIIRDHFLARNPSLSKPPPRTTSDEEPRVKGHASVVTLLLANGRVDPNMADQNGNTAIMGAADKGHASVVTLLLANGRVDPNIAEQNGNTALMGAADKGHASVVKLLLADDAA